MVLTFQQCLHVDDTDSNLIIQQKKVVKFCQLFRHEELRLTFDLAAKDTIVRWRSFFSCAGVRAGKELALAAKDTNNFKVNGATD